jgi:recombinational DNA repair protein (RecF pathway)
MSIVKDQARVLRVYEQGNTSLVLVLLGRTLGQVRVLGKGARRWTRKGFEGGFDLLTEGQLVAYPRAHGELWILKEWDERARFNAAAERPLLRAGSFLCEFTEALTRETAGSGWSHEDGHDATHTPEELYDLLTDAVTGLSGDREPGWVLLRYVLAAMEQGGWLPDLDACSSCHTKLPAGATPVRLSHAGVLCQKCAAGDPALYEDRGRPGPESVRCVWLSPEVLGALAFVKRTGQTVRLSSTAANSLARATMLLIHSALEHDLRTLNGAATAIARLATSRRPKKTLK